ncbi:MAG: hypothetical protein ACM31O_03700 [Bacteroidota bacterium]
MSRARRAYRGFRGHQTRHLRDGAKLLTKIEGFRRAAELAELQGKRWFSEVASEAERRDIVRLFNMLAAGMTPAQRAQARGDMIAIGALPPDSTSSLEPKERL